MVLLLPGSDKDSIFCAMPAMVLVLSLTSKESDAHRRRQINANILTEGIEELRCGRVEEGRG